MVRASESLCGFKMTDAQCAEALKASQFLEEKLGFSKEKADGLYNKIELFTAQRRISGPI
jgi:hypothetical protein